MITLPAVSAWYSQLLAVYSLWCKLLVDDYVCCFAVLMDFVSLLSVAAAAAAAATVAASTAPAAAAARCRRRR